MGHDYSSAGHSIADYCQRMLEEETGKPGPMLHSTLSFYPSGRRELLRGPPRPRPRGTHREQSDTEDALEPPSRRGARSNE